MKVRVTVPASAGSVGSAFDALGIALALADEIVVDTSGKGEGGPPLHPAAIARFEQAAGKKVPAHGLTRMCRIPRGLGDSVAEIVGGLLAADALCETGLSRMRILQLAVAVEGRVERVAAAIYGGAVLTALDEGRMEGALTVVPLRVPASWKAALFVPDTADASMDSTSSSGLVSIWSAAIAQDRPDLLRVAMQERRKIAPAWDVLVRSALEGGAWGACLAGRSVLALASKAEAKGTAVSMNRKALQSGMAGRSLVLDIDPRGARVEPLT